MTQPPSPPNQPPQQGGFGPPQGPPPQQPAPGGFGAPQPPAGPPTPPAPQGPPATPPGFGKAPEQGPGHPQQPLPAPQTPPPPPPGYGYPQAPQPPQGAPQAPPGYGYPGQQPGPYAQPNAYGPQPGYGYPGPPGMPQQPQPGPPGGPAKSKAPLIIIVSAVVAIALIVVGGLVYAKSSGDDSSKKDTANSSGGTGGKDDKDDKGGSGGAGTGGKEKAPADTASKVLFQVPLPTTDDTVVTTGSWLTDKVYAKSGIAEIVGYDPVKGSKLWTVKLPGPVCGATDHITSDNKTAVVFQPRMPKKGSTEGCSQLALIDLDAGTKLWTKTVNSGDRPINFDNVTIAQNTVAVGSTSGGAAFDLSGRVLWQPKPADTCYDAGYGGGARLVAVRKCGSYDNRQLHIQTIDPKSGKVISEYEMTAGIEYAAIVSTDPLVVAADVGDSAGDGSGISDYFSIDNKTGKLRARISAPGEDYAGRCDGISRIEYCRQLVVGGDKLYVPTEEHDGSGQYSKTNEIVAFDLATGKQTGQRGDAGDGYTITPLRMDGANLIAYKRPPYDKGGQIVSIDGSSFKETELLENPATKAVRDAETSMLPDYAEIRYAQGRLYMSAVFAHKTNSTYGKEYLAVAFGTGG
ncbi:PQQ-binding-like beta-propeller repeat protein [Streptomyces sp. NPDC004629]|uniref:outer membrane protein assembly factor BamB family protein n=1 Tax=Streptomyces sp. NPDC004629 TaxID=3364705 RepID=UPI0036B16DCB